MNRPTLALAALFAAILTASPADAIELQGHRGARGLYPENTLPAFAKALELNVDTLELDIAITRDGVAVISHNPELEPDLARRDGKWLDEPVLIHGLDAAALAAYDVGRARPGSRTQRGFPAQQAVDDTPPPRLDDLFKLVEKRRDKRVRFNIETKLTPDGAGRTPPPEVFADIVVKTVRDAGLAARVTVQSFDWRTLLHIRRTAPDIATACLTAQRTWLDNVRSDGPAPSPWLGGLDVRTAGGVPEVVKLAGCAVWSPYWQDVGAAELAEAHALGLKVIVWTVNKPEDMKSMAMLGVDGIITDYPDIARELLQDFGRPLNPAK